jgi:hypothetical protein
MHATRNCETELSLASRRTLNIHLEVISSVPHRLSRIVPHRPQDWVVFIVLSSLCLSLCFLLGYFGVRLLQERESVIPLNVGLFASEIAYALFNVVVFWMIPPISMSSVTIGFWQVAEGSLVPQFITGYPLWGMVILTILWKFPNLFRRAG